MHQPFDLPDPPVKKKTKPKPKKPVTFINVSFPFDEERIVTLTLPSGLDKDDMEGLARWIKGYLVGK